MTSKNDTVSHQNLWAGKIAKFWCQGVTVHCYLVYLRLFTDNHCYSEVLMNFQLQNFQIMTLRLVPWETVNFGSLKSQSTSGNNIIENIGILGKQNKPFPSRPIIKCLLFHSKLICAFCKFSCTISTTMLYQNWVYL